MVTVPEIDRMSHVKWLTAFTSTTNKSRYLVKLTQLPEISSRGSNTNHFAFNYKSPMD